MDLTPNDRQPFPLEDLPEELWVQIIKDHVTYKHTEDIFYVDLDLLLPLTLVSNAWRRRIENAPSLWTDIVLSNKTADLAMKVTLCLHFSKAAHLSIHFQRSSRSWPLVTEQIISQSSRIHKITIHSSYNGGLFEHEIQAIIQQLEPLTSLAQVICSGFFPEKIQWAHLIEQHPSIVDVRGLSLGPSTLLHDSRQWRRVFSAEEPNSILPALQTITSLRMVELIPLSRPSAPAPALTTRPLRWEYLTYSDMFRFPISLLINLQSHLIYLKFEIDAGVLVDILPVLEGCIHLRDLNIKLFSNFSLPGLNVEVTGAETKDLNEQSPPAKDRPTTRSNKNIEILTIQWMRSPGDEGLTIPLSLMRKIQKSMPSVNKLALNGFSLYDASILSLHSWSLLDDLEIEPYSATNPKEADWTLPNTLRRFKMVVSRQNFCQVRSATVERLNIEGRDDKDVHPKGSCDISQWLHLRSLQVHGLIQVPCKAPLLWLREVHFYGYDGEHHPANKLYQQLAMNPSDLPALESLQHIAKVEWDILFIFLERRNLTNSAMASPIKQLIIRRPNLTLENALRQLLKRKSGKRPGNYDISWEGNAKILYDLSIPGCLFCHNCLRYCNHPAEEDWDGPDLTHLLYPDSEDEVLATWESRRAVWSQLPESERAYYCSNGKQIVTITDQSIEDPTYERGNEEPMLEEDRLR